MCDRSRSAVAHRTRRVLAPGISAPAWPKAERGASRVRDSKIASLASMACAFSAATLPGLRHRYLRRRFLSHRRLSVTCRVHAWRRRSASLQSLPRAWQSRTPGWHSSRRSCGLPPIKAEANTVYLPGCFSGRSKRMLAKSSSSSSCDRSVIAASTLRRSFPIRKLNKYGSS